MITDALSAAAAAAAQRREEMLLCSGGCLRHQQTAASAVSGWWIGEITNIFSSLFLEWNLDCMMTKLSRYLSPEGPAEMTVHRMIWLVELFLYSLWYCENNSYRCDESILDWICWTWWSRTRWDIVFDPSVHPKRVLSLQSCCLNSGRTTAER